MVRNCADQYNRITQLAFLCMATVFLFLLAGYRPLGIDSDSLTYESEIINSYNGTSEIKEPVFLIFSYISDAFLNKDIRSVFVMYAFFSISIKMYAITKYSSNIILSLIVYAGMFFILHDMTQIRVGLAAAFFLLALPDLINQNRKKYIIKITAAALCHFSAMILFPLIFLSVKKINFKVIFLTPLLMLCFVLFVGDMSAILISFFGHLPEPISTKGISYIQGVQLYGRFDEVNIFSKFTLSSFFFFIIYILSSSKSGDITASDIIYLKLFSIMLTIFYFFSSVPVLASRTFELFAVSFIFSFPAIASKFKPSWISATLIAAWVFLYLCVVNLKLIGM